MFLKPFRVKSNSQLKGSERKKLRARLCAENAQLSADSCAELLPGTEQLSAVRLLTHAGDAVTCYLSDAEPLLLQLPGSPRLLPTVYALWRRPELLPAFTTHAPVVQRLRAGADLMLPGVVCTGRLADGRPAYPRLEKHAPVAVNSTGNRAAAAVGLAARCSQDLYMMAGKGKAVLLVHVVGDQLWQMGSRRPPPELGPPPGLLPDGERDGADAADEDEDVDGAGGEAAEQADAAGDDGAVADGEAAAVGDDARVADALSAGVDSLVVSSADATADTPDAPPAAAAATADTSDAPPAAAAEPSMDQLLYDAFRRAWRTSAKKLELPVLVSGFYAQHMQPNSARPLDVKRSSYKKLSKFLEKMRADGLVDVREMKPGVQSIVSVNLEHSELRQFRVQPLEDHSPQEAAPAQQPRVRSRPLQSIQEMYLVSGAVSALFRQLNVNKGTPLTAQEVRSKLTDYVKHHQLQDEQNKSQVRLDATLCDCLSQRQTGGAASLRWDELHQKVLEKMSPGHVITFAGEPPLLKKGNVPKIELNTATRSGNKKVTLVLNLPVFGVDAAEFAHRCQHGVAASTSVGDAPNRPAGTVQVLVQGNQIRFIGKLLQDDYKIPKKYIQGLEKAPKK